MHLCPRRLTGLGCSGFGSCRSEGSCAGAGDSDLCRLVTAWEQEPGSDGSPAEQSEELTGSLWASGASLLPPAVCEASDVTFSFPMF